MLINILPFTGGSTVDCSCRLHDAAMGKVITDEDFKEIPNPPEIAVKG